MQCPSSVAIEVIADGQRSLMSYEEMDAHVGSPIMTARKPGNY